MESVLFDKENGIGWMTLNRPDTRNALSSDMMSNMQQKLTQIRDDADVRVVVIRANGPVFCAGHNIREMAGEHDIHHFRNIFNLCSELMQSLHLMPQPVIAQVQGIATAAGCQLVAACDLAIAEQGARFATPGVKIGLFCSTPMVPLSRVIGRRRAMEMLLTGRFVSAQEAYLWGLVNKVVEAEKLAEETTIWATELAQHSRFTLGFGKRAFYTQIEQDEATAYTFTKDQMAVNCLSEDAQEGMTAFIEKRKPVWKDR
jgi:enoyl-CoA hydratase/carnithine racemase